MQGRLRGCHSSSSQQARKLFTHLSYQEWRQDTCSICLLGRLHEDYMKTIKQYLLLALGKQPSCLLFACGLCNGWFGKRQTCSC